MCSFAALGREQLDLLVGAANAGMKEVAPHFGEELALVGSFSVEAWAEHSQEVAGIKFAAVLVAGILLNAPLIVRAAENFGKVVEGPQVGR